MQKDPKIIISRWIPFYDAYALMGRWVLLKPGYREEILAHELVHIRQEREIGPIKYHLKWIFNRRFRAKVEIEAYEEANSFTKAKITGILEKYYSVFLSSSEYDQIKNGGY
jgi:hypothetical protein